MSTSARNVEPARIGLLFDYLDPRGEYDPNIERLLQLTADEYRAAGILERPIEFIKRGVQGLPNGSFRAVRDAFFELVEADVQVIFGPWVSENGVALQPYVEELGRPPRPPGRQPDRDPRNHQRPRGPSSNRPSSGPAMTPKFSLWTETPTPAHYRHDWTPTADVAHGGSWLSSVGAGTGGREHFGLRGFSDFVYGMTHLVSPVCGFRSLQPTLDGAPPHLFDELSPKGRLPGEGIWRARENAREDSFRVGRAGRSGHTS